jgi:hypothetical protein
VVIGRAAQEARADARHLVAHAEADALEEEALRRGGVGRRDHDVRELRGAAATWPEGRRASARRRAPCAAGRVRRVRASAASARCAAATSSTRTPAIGSTARASALALDRDAEAIERRRDAREIVRVVDADREREQRAARRRLDAELLAAVARLEASGRALVEPEVAVEGADRSAAGRRS